MTDYYHIISHKGTGRCLNIYGNDTVSNSRNVCLYDKGSGTSYSKHWGFEHYNNILKVFTRINNEYALNKVDCGSNPNNCTMYKNPSFDDGAVALIPYDAGNGLYKIKLIRHNQYLAAEGNYNLANVYWSSSSTGDHKIWKLEKLNGSAGPVITGENYLTYPLKYIQIGQRYWPSETKNSHYYHNSHDGLNDWITPVDYPIDDSGENKSGEGKSNFYCPCNEMEIVKTTHDNGYVNGIWAESTSKVKLANGEEDYISMMVLHMNDDQFEKGRLDVGNKFKRGEFMFKEGNDGGVKDGVPVEMAEHFHIAVGTGKFTSERWKPNNKGAWVITVTGRTLKPEEAFYVNSNFTTILNDYGITFKSKSL